jgi:hypothetical protein
MRQFLAALHEPVLIQPFYGMTGGGMESLSACGQKTVVDDLLRQGMGEDISSTLSNYAA